MWGVTGGGSAWQPPEGVRVAPLVGGDNGAASVVKPKPGDLGLPPELVDFSQHGRPECGSAPHLGPSRT